MKHDMIVDGEALSAVEGVDVTHLVGATAVVDMQEEPQRAAFNAYRVAFRANEAKPNVPNAVALVTARNDLADKPFEAKQFDNPFKGTAGAVGMVSVVPAIIITTSGTAAEAENFVAINRDRKNVTPLDLYWAELAADDPEAKTVAQVCERAGITIVRSTGGQTRAKVSETAAISAIRSLIDRRGAMRARQMLDVLAKAELKPISAMQIKGVEVLLTDAEFADQIEPDAITEAIRGHALVIEDEANAFAATHRLPKAKAFASVWFKRCRKKRKAA